MFLALAAAFAVYLAYNAVIRLILGPPPPPPAARQPATQPASQPPPATSPATRPPGSATQPQAATTSATAPATLPYRLVAGQDESPLTLGGRDGDALKVELLPRGGAVARIWLTERDKKGRYVFRATPDGNDPYPIIQPVETPAGEFLSYVTRKVWVLPLRTEPWQTDELVWRIAERSPTRVVFETTLLRNDDGQPVLRLRKTWELVDGKPLVMLRLEAENLSDQPVEVAIEQDGPVGIHKEHLQYDMRRLVIAARTPEGQIELFRTLDHGKLAKAEGPVNIPLAEEQRSLLWMALTNKYFGVFTRPLPRQGKPQVDWVGKLVALLAWPDAPARKNPGDLLTRLDTHSAKLAPGGRTQVSFELYAGAKDPGLLRKVNPAFADPTGLGYELARSADQRCCCTFLWLTDIMSGLLRLIYLVVHNYGVALIILVILIRTLLHPLTVFQQKSMYRVQEGQMRLQPRLAELKEKYGNDKVRLQQEMMKLYAEEGVNPAGMLVGMLPMLIQMPILIALWTALNTDIHLRHAPFDGWWIKDLSAPDALIRFPGDGLTIPILGQLLPFMFANIPSLNLLPILMGISMYLQQKYMPKPHLEAQKRAAEQGKAEKNALGMTPEEQIRQQQMIGVMMSVLFPLMFYYMPSGLNLYWMATNVFGIIESLIIRRQLEEERKKREQLGPQALKKKEPGRFAQLMQRLAEKAEEIQKQADQLSRDEVKTPKRLRKMRDSKKRRR